MCVCVFVSCLLFEESSDVLPPSPPRSPSRFYIHFSILTSSSPSPLPRETSQKCAGGGGIPCGGRNWGIEWKQIYLKIGLIHSRRRDNIFLFIRLEAYMFTYSDIWIQNSIYVLATFNALFKIKSGGGGGGLLPFLPRYAPHGPVFFGSLISKKGRCATPLTPPARPSFTAPTARLMIHR